MNLEDKIAFLRGGGWDLSTPASDIIATAGGRCQVFPLATIYENSHGEAYEVHGAIRLKYCDFNQTVGSLGFPTSDEMDDPNVSGGRLSTFEHGTIQADPDDGVSVTLTSSSATSEAGEQGSAEGDGAAPGAAPPAGPPTDTNGVPANDGAAPTGSSYAAQAQAAYDTILGNGHQNLATSSATANGDNTSKQVFSPEFDQLQKLLTKVTFWTQDEEDARTLLVAYAKDEVAKLLAGGLAAGQLTSAYIPDNIMYQLERLGLSESNQAAVANYQQQRQSGGAMAAVPSLADFEVHSSAENWCGQTQSLAFVKSLQAHGLALQGGRVAWMDAHAQNLSFDSPLHPGDWFTMIGNASPVSGHIGGVIYRDGTTLYYISGNAGGGAAPGEGTVRIDKVTIAPPAPGFNWNYNAAKNTPPKVPGKTNPAESGVIWLATVIRFSLVDFEEVDGLLDQDPEGKLTKWGLLKKAA